MYRKPSFYMIYNHIWQVNMRIMRTAVTTPTSKLRNPCHFVSRKGISLALKIMKSWRSTPQLSQHSRSLAKHQAYSKEMAIVSEVLWCKRNNSALQGAYWKFVCILFWDTLEWNCKLPMIKRIYIQRKAGRMGESKDLSNVIVGDGKFKILRAGQWAGNPGKN